MPSSDWENYKEEVRAKSDILSVVGAHLKLRKVGRRFVGLCPFHSDTKPSFYVDPEKGIFHCFGCGAGGDVFSFVMQTEGLDFPGALALQARRWLW
ncbi:DNA primase [subsurface metagenome]